jgi:AhpD family alkylhydroperoxidase
MNTKYQNPLSLPTAEAIPSESLALFEGVKKKFGFVPNAITAFSRSPAVLEAYLKIAELVSKTSFTPAEQHAGALIISQYHKCGYCLAAHGTIGRSVGLSSETVVALQTGESLHDERLEALRTLLVSILCTRGFPKPEAVEAFKTAGFDDTQLLEAVLLVTWETLANFTNHLHDTPIDPEFAANATPETCATEASACSCA